jgi:hypothetical protein
MSVFLMALENVKFFIETAGRDKKDIRKDVRKVPTNVPYLKNKSVGYRGKKSKILTQEDISKFIEEAADEKNLLKKVMNIHIYYT